MLSLTSDFGLRDPYVAEIKAVILGICPTATIVDITHEVDKFNVHAGAFMLASAAPYFPNGTVHIAVVDPGVGTARRPIVVETERGFFVGPDNGLLLLAAEAQGIKQIRLIGNRKLMQPQVSDTFHGRDVFAPAAAHLANDVKIEQFGAEITDPEKPLFTKVKRGADSVAGEVLHLDGFGNIITNIRLTDVDGFGEGMLQIAFAENPPVQMKLSRTYADAEPGEALALVGSHGFIEVALNLGSAAKKFSAKVGDRIVLKKSLNF